MSLPSGTVAFAAVVIGLLSSSAAQTSPFISHRLASGLASTQNVIGDVDGDGHLDVVTASGGQQVLFGAGDGSFAGQPIAGVTFGNDPTLADLDQDGRLDLGFARGLGDAIQFHLGQGDGSFVAVAAAATAHNAADMELADFDGDGLLDAIVACRQDIRASLLPGMGDGTFGAKTDLGPVGDGAATVGTGDLDGDGAPDFAIANFYSDTLSVFVNDGKGGFDGPATLPTGLVGFGIASPAFADLDEDGLLDVAVATTVAPYLFMGLGDGSLAPAVALPALAGGISAVSVVDLDEDDDLDLLVRGGGFASAQALLGHGDGNFDAPLAIGAGSASYDLDHADLNEDGDIDLLAGNGGSDDLVLLLGQGDGSFTGIAMVDCAPQDVTVLDLDGDGRLDILSAGIVGQDGVFAALLGDGAGNLSPAVMSPGLSHVTDLDAGDLDGDGVPDIAVVRETFLSPRTAWAQGLGDGSFGPVIDLVMGGDLDAVRLADLDGDDDLDVVAASTGTHQAVIRAGHGDGGFDPALTLPVWFSPIDLLTADWNADGLPDLTTFHNASGTTVELRLGLGGLAFAAPIQRNLGGASQGGRLAAADMDSDGALDLLLTAVPGAALGVLLGNGDGSFGPLLGASGGQDPRRIAVADVDRDGDLDAVVANEYRFFDKGSVSVFLNPGTGDLLDAIEVATGPNPTAVVLADMDGDGADDAVVSAMGAAQVEVLASSAGPWRFLGRGLRGSAGIPRQRASGHNASGAPFAFSVSDALPGGNCWWILGLTELSAAFKGGTLVPTPDVIVGPFPLDGAGSFGFASTGPALPAGIEVFYQWWLPDAGGPKGFAATNALHGVTF